MNKFKGLIFVGLVLLSACQTSLAAPRGMPRLLGFQRAAAVSQANQTLTGNFKRHQNFKSAHLRHPRDILVYLPPSYSRSPQRRYPVLYMHDGNNLFDRSTAFGGQEWQVDETVGRLIAAGEITEPIVVGIYNTPDRIREYTWHPMDFDGETQGGGGAQYARFLISELKPVIDTTYRTLPGRESTGTMGSSLGGLISFYLGLYHPETFSAIGIVSPSLWWANRQAIADAARIPANLKVWVDIGTREGEEGSETVQDARDFVQVLEGKGYQHFKNLAFHIAEGAGHNEAAWAARVDRPLRFFYER